MYLLDDDANRQHTTSFMTTNLSMSNTQPSFFNTWIIGEDRRHIVGGLLLVLVTITHIALKTVFFNAPPIEPPKIKIVEIDLLVAPPPPPVAPPAAPAPPTPPKVEPPKPKPKPLPPKPKPVPKPKPKPVEIPKPDDFKIPVPTLIKEPITPAPPAPPAPPKPAAPVAPSAPSAGTAVHGNQKPTCISCPHPHYPDLARRRNWQGTVRLKIQVGSDGRVDSVSIVSSSGYDELDEAAVDDVKSWRFVSGDAGTVRVATQSINFKLDNDDN